VVPALAVLAAAVASNLLFLHESYESYERTSRLERADLAAVEIARDTVDPSLILSEDIADTGYVPVEAGAYLSARDAFGSPAYTEAELEAAPEEARIPADKVLAAALGIELERTSALPVLPPPPTCHAVHPDTTAPELVEPTAEIVILHAVGGPVEIELGRFSDEFPVQLGSVLGGDWGIVRIPADTSKRRWRVQLSGSAKVTVCDLGRRLD
jgi:hypothetical protein